ncbi:hypothetical protein OSB04_023692 [Centaurea solstitialis]|uniref:DDE Tnp4 domain-containing protein n=1 Tax=Centaurea solstitialis TaxID=347529 RepID=A0AA38SX42_9ASTR|nr:hypothetical protein OSB04_023692 [Centaurea solstitialis]
MLVDEQVAMFLQTLAYNAKNMILVNRFHRSGETISWYFKLVLNVACRLNKEFYKTPVPVPDNKTDKRWKWFKSCVRALDGTYVKVKVSAVDRKSYRTRKGEICTNVLEVCTRDLLFTYVLAGWGGSAADSRVLQDAISRPNGLKITQETYYLCDAGYTNGEGFLTPYRGQHYHLYDWSRPPTNAKELFNMRHSSARNVIERCFGLFKARWAILRGRRQYLKAHSAHLVIARLDFATRCLDKLPKLMILEYSRSFQSLLTNLAMPDPVFTMPNMADSNVTIGTGRSKHTWTNDEDVKLIDAFINGLTCIWKVQGPKSYCRKLGVNYVNFGAKIDGKDEVLDLGSISRRKVIFGVCRCLSFYVCPFNKCVISDFTSRIRSSIGNQAFYSAVHVSLPMIPNSGIRATS